MWLATIQIYWNKKKRVYRRKEFNSQTIGLEHQHGRPFNVLGHQHGGHDVSIAIMLCSLAQTIILRIRFWKTDHLPLP